MRVALLVSILTLVVLAADGQEQPDLSDPETLQKILGEAVLGDTLEVRRSEGGKLLYPPDGKSPYTGWAKTKHLNGKVRRLVHLKDGKLDGSAIWWHENGQKAAEGSHKNGKQEGPYTLWHDNAQKMEEGTYKGGKQEGPTTMWHENGRKKQEAILMGGKREGLCIVWHENGEKAAEGTFKDGKQEGSHVTWHENGEKAAEAIFMGGKKEGRQTIWHENGQKKQEVTFKDGKKEGSGTEWHENGQKSLEVSHEDGKLEGLATKWDENGVVVSQDHFKNGRLISENAPDLNDPETLEEIVGKAVRWDTLKQVGLLYHVAGSPVPYTGWIKKFHDNGKVAALGMLKGGKPDGLWTLWDADGQKEEEVRYVDGVRFAD